MDVQEEEKTFKKSFPFHKKKKLSESLEVQFPSCIPVILESRTIDLSKNKFLVPDNATVSFFLRKVRKYITSISENTAYYLITDSGVMLTPTEYISSIQHRHKRECGFLYINIEKEDSYG